MPVCVVCVVCVCVCVCGVCEWGRVSRFEQDHQKVVLVKKYLETLQERCTRQFGKVFWGVTHHEENLPGRNTKKKYF